MLKSFGVAAVVVVLAAGSAVAGEIQARKENQQDRIAQGIAAGTLSAGEAARLEGQEAALNREERAMRRLDHGRLTAQDRRVINGQQNRLSRRIYRTKHDIGHK